MPLGTHSALPVQKKPTGFQVSTAHAGGRLGMPRTAAFPSPVSQVTQSILCSYFGLTEGMKCGWSHPIVWQCAGLEEVFPRQRCGSAWPSMHRSRAVRIGTPTKGVNIVPLMAASLGLIGDLARETSARRHAWRLFASAAALVHVPLGCSFDGCLSR